MGNNNDETEKHAVKHTQIKEGKKTKTTTTIDSGVWRGGGKR